MVIIFTRQLYTLIKAGLPLLKALQIVYSQLPKGKFKNDIEKTVIEIQEGKSFSDALSSSSHYFSLFYVNMIKAAEVSGNLVGILKELSEHFTKQSRITRQIQAAVMYPVLILFIAVSIMTSLFIFVVPVFVKIFQDLGGRLPPATEFLIWFSHFVIKWGWVVLIGIFLIVVAILLLSRRPYGKFILNKVTWHLPLIGRLLKIVNIGRFCRTIGTLLSSGINLMKGLEVLEETSTSVVLSKAITDIKTSIEQGASLSESMEETKVFPIALVRMIQTGEETGKISELFLDAADDYEEEVSFAMSGFLSLLEPALIVIMGAVVGFIVIALFFPIFTMGTLIK